MDEIEGLDPKYMLYGFALGTGRIDRADLYRPERDRDDHQGLVRQGRGRLSHEPP